MIRQDRRALGMNKTFVETGVNLEDEVWITADGPVIISLYPYEENLLG